MLAGLSKSRPSFTKLCENSLNVNTRLFTSTPATSAGANFSKTERTPSRRHSVAERGDLPPLFGLRPPDQNPWDESDPRFAKELPSLALRFGESSKMRAKLRKEGKLRIDKKGPPKLFPLTETMPVESQEEPSGRIRAKPPLQLEHYGISSDIMNMSRVNEASSMESTDTVPQSNTLLVPNSSKDATSTLEILNLIHDVNHGDLRAWCDEFGGISQISFPSEDSSYCRIHFQSQEHALLAKEQLSDKNIFLGPPLIRLSNVARVVSPSQYLVIQDFKGLRSDLAEATGSFIATSIHLVTVQLKGARLRIDALLKFRTHKDAFEALSRLEGRRFSPTDTGAEVQMIDSKAYSSVLSPPEEAASMAEFASPPTMTGSHSGSLQPFNSRSNSTLWLGNIPGELLEEKSQIVAKFSKYGQLADVRIPDKGSDRPRGFMSLEFIRQEDAESCFQDLIQRPIFLFGRQLRVDYAPSSRRERPPYKPSPADGLSSRTVFLSGLRDNLINDPWALLDVASQFGEVIDLRIMRSPPTAFVDFMHPDGAKTMIQAVCSKKVQSLPPEINARYGTKLRRLEWDSVMKPASDTLRVTGIPLRALGDTVMMREAFGDKRKLLDIRIVKDNGWPVGVAYLQFASVDAAKETLDWMRSDPENPVTFFGRDVRANFSETRGLMRGADAKPRRARTPYEDL